MLLVTEDCYKCCLFSSSPSGFGLLLVLIGGVVVLGEAQRGEGQLWSSWVEDSHLKVRNGQRPCV